MRSALRAARPPLALLLLLTLAGLAANAFWPHAPDHPYWGEALLAPGIGHGHWLGTDAIGRDLLARVAAGTLVSLAIGALAGVVALLLGLLLGALAGYRGGAFDEALMRLVDIASSLPLLLVTVLLLAVLEPSLALLALLVGGYGALDATRLMRAEARRLRGHEFIVAAQVQGASTARILLRHLGPNLVPAALTAFGTLVPQAILVESFLAFLGLGPSDRAGSLGTLLAEGVQDMAFAPWTLWVPAATLALVLLGFGWLGDRLRTQLAAETGHAG
jgi:oligopeptide transport system permease protein